MPDAKQCLTVCELRLSARGSGRERPVSGRFENCGSTPGQADIQAGIRHGSSVRAYGTTRACARH